MEYVPPEVWWGFSRVHGWIVLDRTWRLNNGETQFFVRCSDWELIPVRRREWRSPEYQYFEQYIPALPQPEKHRSREELDHHQVAFDRERISLHARCAAALHDSFLHSHGIEGAAVYRSCGDHRTPNCWSCSRGLASDRDWSCSSCRGLVCSFCHACFCGYASYYRRAFARDD